jgi:lipopolysaccharide transport system ATP-binding protein
VGDPAVIFDGVWKKFRRGERHDSLRDLIPSLAKRLWKRIDAELEAEEFWAVKDVSFEVKPGDALGIIGPNGAGKSTVLKLLTRILKPTRGRCEVRGRVGALIEVAAGFHPDLTGRENIFLQGAIMGMKQREIARKLDDIIAFAGVDELIDTPVKRYSSGMNARLGFSIAAHLDPEVLVIDEVLAVGDMAFQRRCFERMGEFRRRGVAIVLVSHNLQAVAGLCERALSLRRSVVAIGPAPDVIADYVRAGEPGGDDAAKGPARIRSAALLDERGAPVSTVEPGAPLLLRAVYEVREPLSDVHFGLIVYRSTDDLPVYSGNFHDRELSMGPLQPGERLAVEFRFRAHLTRGQYHIECHVCHNPTQRHLARLLPAAVFSVDEMRTYSGVAYLDASCRVTARERTEHANRESEQGVAQR